MEVFSLSLELGRGVDLVGHDASDGLLHVLHPFGHLGVAHLVDVLQKKILPTKIIVTVYKSSTVLLITKNGQAFL